MLPCASAEIPHHPIRSPIGGGYRHGTGALCFTVRERGFQILLCDGFDNSYLSEPQNDEKSAVKVARYASAGVALHDTVTLDSWLLVHARHRLSIPFRGSLLALPEQQLVILAGKDVNAGGFQDFRGAALLVQENSLSPYDRKLLGRRTGSFSFSSGWGHILGTYLGNLDATTLRLIGRDTSGWALMEQQIIELLRRALLERFSRVRSWSEHSGDDSRKARNRGELLFKNVCTWVANNFTDPEITLESVGKHFGISPRYIQNLFAKYGGGATFVSFLRKKRLYHAREMLAGADYAHLNIADICWNCGFADPVYFGKVFREFFGMTPSQARRQSLRKPPGIPSSAGLSSAADPEPTGLSR